MAGDETFDDYYYQPIFAPTDKIHDANIVLDVWELVYQIWLKQSLPFVPFFHITLVFVLQDRYGEQSLKTSASMPIMFRC